MRRRSSHGSGRNRPLTGFQEKRAKLDEGVKEPNIEKEKLVLPNSRYDKASRPSAARPGKMVVAIIQPQSISLRANRKGETYATVRADVAFGNRTLERTVMVYAQSYPKFASVLAPRRPLQVKLARALVCDDKGRPGGEFLIARSIVDVLDVPAPATRRAAAAPAADPDAPARRVTPHMRSGYYRRQRYGKGGQLVKIVWIHACEVGGTKAHSAPARTRRLAAPSPRRSGVAQRAAAPEGWTSTAA